MPQPSVGTDLHQPPDVHCHLAAEIPFHDIGSFDHSSEFTDLAFGQVTHTGLRIDTSLCNNLPGALDAYAVDIGESVFDFLIPWEVYTCNSSQATLPSNQLYHAQRT